MQLPNDGLSVLAVAQIDSRLASCSKITVTLVGEKHISIADYFNFNVHSCVEYVLALESANQLPDNNDSPIRDYHLNNEQII